MTNDTIYVLNYLGIKHVHDPHRYFSTLIGDYGVLLGEASNIRQCSIGVRSKHIDLPSLLQLLSYILERIYA